MKSHRTYPLAGIPLLALVLAFVTSGCGGKTVTVPGDMVGCVYSSASSGSAFERSIQPGQSINVAKSDELVLLPTGDQNYNITTSSNRTAQAPSRVLALHGFWETTGFALNVLVFLLVGMQIHADMLVAEAGSIAIALVALHAGRAVAVYGCFAVLRAATREIVPLRWQPYSLTCGITRSSSVVAPVGDAVAIGIGVERRLGPELDREIAARRCSMDRRRSGAGGQLEIGEPEIRRVERRLVRGSAGVPVPDVAREALGR